jgi:hypothetical protein
LTAQQLFGWRRAARRAIEEVSANGSAFTPVIVEAAPPCAEAAGGIDGSRRTVTDDRDHRLRTEFKPVGVGARLRQSRGKRRR